MEHARQATEPHPQSCPRAMPESPCPYNLFLPNPGPPDVLPILHSLIIAFTRFPMPFADRSHIPRSLMA